LKSVLLWFNPDRFLALVAIVAGLIAIAYETDLRREFHAQDAKITELVSSVTTGYAAQFPNDLDHIISLLGEAKNGDEIWIVTDLVGYGAYSSPKDYRRYVDSITEARVHGATIKLLIYPPTTFKRDMLLQFSLEDYGCMSGSKTPGEKCKNEVDEQLKFKEFYSFYENYLKDWGCKNRKTDRPHIDFLNDFTCINIHYCGELTAQPNVYIHIMKDSPDLARASNSQILFWLLRKEGGTHNYKAIFSFPNFSSAENGISFHTADEHLLNILAKQFKQFDAASAVQDKCYPRDLFSAADEVEIAKNVTENTKR
jgi:hypothetical protein